MGTSGSTADTPIISGNVISDGNLSVYTTPKSSTVTVTAQIDGKPTTAQYQTKVSPDGASSFVRSEINFNQEKNLMPLVENKSKAYPRLKKALDAHGGLCDIMCTHIAMGDLISEENKASTPYKMGALGAKPNATSIEQYNNDTIKLLKGEAPGLEDYEHELSTNEKNLLDKLENDIAKFHFLKQVTVFQIFKAAIFEKIPHNHLSSDQQDKLNKTTKALKQKTPEEKKALIKEANDISKSIKELEQYKQGAKGDQEAIEKFKKEAASLPDNDHKRDLEAHIANSEKSLENKKKNIENKQAEIGNRIKEYENKTGSLHNLLSSAADNIEPGKYAKFMSYERNGTEFSGHTMLIRNNGNGKYSFFDPDSGLKSNVDKAELMVILTKAFLQCDNQNLAVVNVHKMIPKQELKVEASKKETATNKEANKENNPLSLGNANHLTTQYQQKPKTGFFAGLRERANSNPLELKTEQKQDDKSKQRKSVS